MKDFNVDAVRALIEIQNGQYMTAYKGKDAAAVEPAYILKTLLFYRQTWK